jgi:hypothetical protein
VDHHVMNRGVQVERVAAATHAPIHTTVIHDAPAGSAFHGGGIYRPQLSAPARPVNMVAQRIDDRHPVVQHNPATPMRVENHSPAAPTTMRNAASSAAPNNHATVTTAPGMTSRPGNVSGTVSRTASQPSAARSEGTHVATAPQSGQTAGSASAASSARGQQHYSLQSGAEHPGTALPATASRARSVQSTPRSIAESRGGQESDTTGGGRGGRR